MTDGGPGYSTMVPALHLYQSAFNFLEFGYASAIGVVLFVVMLRLNYDYIMMLFEEPLGQKMLIFGIIMQILGAIAIKKIITIKV